MQNKFRRNSVDSDDTNNTVKFDDLNNAMADIYAISRCRYLIGSDSTFSGWGAFLGQVPCVFFRKHYGKVLRDEANERVEDATNTWL